MGNSSGNCGLLRKFREETKHVHIHVQRSVYLSQQMHHKLCTDGTLVIYSFCKARIKIVSNIYKTFLKEIPPCMDLNSPNIWPRKNSMYRL